MSFVFHESEDSNFLDHELARDDDVFWTDSMQQVLARVVELGKRIGDFPAIDESLKPLSRSMRHTAGLRWTTLSGSSAPPLQAASRSLYGIRERFEHAPPAGLQG